jgi:sulfur-carrier protein
VIQINVTGFLTDFTNGRSVITLESSPSTVGQALSELWMMYPGLRDRVLTEQGQVRMHVNVFLEDENIRRKELLDTQLPDKSEITILPSVSGGGS